MNDPLSNAARVAAEFRAQLAAEFHMEADDEAIDGTLEGMTDLPELLARADQEVARAETHAEGLAELIKAEQSRKSRLEAKAARLRNAMSLALQEAGFRRMSLPTGTLTLSAGKKPLVIDDTKTIPDAYLKPPAPRDPDKTAIRKALEGGAVLDFAKLGNQPQTLTIRRG